MPACVPVRAEAHRASLVIRSNKESKAFCLAFFVLQFLCARLEQGMQSGFKIATPFTLQYAQDG
jgi:hypothetical protein